MKKVSALAALAFSLVAINAFAHPISQERLSSYQEAVGLSLQQNPLKCTFTVGQTDWDMTSLASAISNTTSGEIHEEGRQPLLVLSNESYPFTFEITTSEDYKTVTFIKFVQKSCSTQTQDVNHGTIENPEISPETVKTCNVSFAATCQ